MHRLPHALKRTWRTDRRRIKRAEAQDREEARKFWSLVNRQLLAGRARTGADAVALTT